MKSLYFYANLEAIECFPAGRDGVLAEVLPRRRSWWCWWGESASCVLGQLIADVTGLPFAHAAQKLVLQPRGLDVGDGSLLDGETAAYGGPASRPSRCCAAASATCGPRSCSRVGR